METPVKILVVDDEMPICELMKINLELAGFSVDIANSAEEALQKHLADYALMVFDIMMGEISGLELVSKVRAMPDVANVPIIVCTALGNEAPLIDGFTRGADDYIKKPFSMREFVVRVKSRSSPPLQSTRHCLSTASLKLAQSTAARLLSQKRNSTCCFFSFQTPTKSSHATRFSTKSGRRTSMWSTAQSMSTSTDCARNSENMNNIL